MLIKDVEESGELIGIVEKKQIEQGWLDLQNSQTISKTSLDQNSISRTTLLLIVIYFSWKRKDS